MPAALRTRHLRAEDLAGRRWRGYIRESTQAQADKWSPDRQRSDIERAAAELGMTGDGHWYQRTGSGESTSTELEEALEDARGRRFDVLVCFATSRFARDRAEAVRLKAEFKRAGCLIYFVAERIISGTYAGALTEGLHEVLDEHANEERRLYIAGGARQRQLAGRWMGAIPWGMRKVMVDRPDGTRGWDGILEPDPELAPTIRQVFERAATGCSNSAIAASLGISGVAVRRILRNPVYAGRLARYRRRTDAHYYDETSPDGRAELPAFDAIVSEELWHRAQRRSQPALWS